METPKTAEPTFKQLKITNYNGRVNYMPLNRTNLHYHEQKKNALSAQKKEKYLIEEVTLSVDEAIALGISEAIHYRNPPKQRKENTTDVVALLTEQNRLLMQMLAEKQEPAKKTK